MGEALKLSDPPPLRYWGSKWLLSDWIVQHFTPHVTYVEPFCGGAAVFFRKDPAPVEVLNDLNGDVINFFDVLRARSDELIQAIDLTPFSRQEFERSFEPSEDSLDRARKFYVRSYQSFGAGGIARRTGWRHVIDDERRSTPAQDWNRLGGLEKAARRLKDASLECRDALWVIEHYDTPKSLFYVDPPYVLSSRNRSTGRYAVEMNDDQHRELADCLHQVQGAVIVSGYQSELYDEIYGDWQISTKLSKNNGNSYATEYLWSNPQATDLSRLPLFEVR